MRIKVTFEKEFDSEKFSFNGDPITTIEEFEDIFLDYAWDDSSIVIDKLKFEEVCQQN